ncbi:uncharacterized protein LOC121738115 [Aricia agestis]|uniref:uncharacterized protein LOC121738115 n=1 Tax=Aricia agestis TaxID=91739 RepID=UPI001C203BD4|nr:uncharacterized protein LOC121738115 [Aricia agestis]
MWLRLLFWCSGWSAVWTQNTVQSGDGAHWGWQVSNAGAETLGHYYVKLPQAEQAVRYSADGGGYHGALAVVTAGPGYTTTTNFALGRRAIELAQAPFYQQTNNTVELQQDQPVDIYLLQQPTNQIYQQVPYQFGTITDLYPDSQRNPFYINFQLENKQNNEQKQQQNVKIEESNDKYEVNENGPVVQVFKDKNCLNDDKKHESNLQKNTQVIVDTPEYNEQNGNFGARENKQETTSRSDRLYYSTEYSPTTTARTVSFTEDEGISRLVASTQDLVSNDDLLRINHAAEKFTSAASDDFIRPQRRQKNAIDRKNRFLVTAKFGNVDQSQEDATPRTSGFKFASPIVVEDFSFDDYKDQIVNNLKTTVGPYIEKGYEIVGVKSTFENNTDNRNYNAEVAITPRPVGPSYLAPITVALRLLNSNDSDVYNSLEDHEGSDSEFVSETVESPHKQKVIVEIQKSVPLDITHINEVEYHEYLDEGRSNTESPLGLVKSLYQRYVASLNQDRNNDYKESKNSDYDTNENDDNSKEDIDSSENIRSEVQVQAIDKSNGYNNYYDQDIKDKIIQPIVIEKQVPVTTYVDRFIEKEVPYPTPYEVVKHVPVDRPVPIPVHFERIVEKPVEVTRYVDKPYPVEVLQPFPVEVRVPYPVERKVYVDRPVHVPFPVEKVIEKQMIHQVPVPTPVAVPVGIEVPVEKKVLYPIGIETPVAVPVPYEKQVPVEKVVEKEVPVPYPVEKRVPYPVPHEVQVPVPYPVEKRVPYPVDRIVEKPVHVTKVVEKPVHIKVPQPVPVEVPRPYPVDRIVERKVPYPVHVEHIVEKKVPVQVPYPVKVEKIVDKPVYITKYVDRPYPVEKRVPYPVEKIVEKKVPYPVEVDGRYNEKQKPDHPYQFERVEPAYLYYGLGYTTQNYLKPQEYMQQNNQQAESQRHYQVQVLDQKNYQNVPIQSTLWGNQYASSFQYLNATENKKPLFVPNSNEVYYGPPPLKNNVDQWNSNSNDRVRKSDRTPKVANLRIEYGFKPPLIPSTEVDLDGVPVHKNES